jgi:hypothetical protein
VHKGKEMKNIHTFVDGDYPVELWQDSKKRFRVIYGSHSKKNLTYSEACTEYGECVFHSLACNGKLEYN